MANDICRSAVPAPKYLPERRSAAFPHHYTPGSVSLHTGLDALSVAGWFKLFLNNSRGLINNISPRIGCYGDLRNTSMTSVLVDNNVAAR